jgi:DNA polymerase-3 subunit delta
MKFYSNNMPAVIHKIKEGEINSVLLFGPDSGMIQEFLHKIASSISCGISGFDQSSDQNLFVRLNNKTLFNPREIIKIDIKSIKLDEEIKKILSKKNLNFPIIIGSELDSSNSIRKFYENSPNMAIIGCYPDDERSVKSIITTILREENKLIDMDALLFLVANLHGDRLLIKSEMQKLLTYSFGIERLSLDICKSIISNSQEGNPDELCIAFAKKDGLNFIKEINNLKSSNINNIWIIRALSRYMLNHLIIKLYECEGVGVYESIKYLKPPIFYKYLDDFKLASYNLSLKEITNILDILAQAEIDAKSYHDDSALNKIFISCFAS